MSNISECNNPRIIAEYLVYLNRRYAELIADKEWDRANQYDLEIATIEKGIQGQTKMDLVKRYITILRRK